MDLLAASAEGQQPADATATAAGATDGSGASGAALLQFLGVGDPPRDSLADEQPEPEGEEEGAGPAGAGGRAVASGSGGDPSSQRYSMRERRAGYGSALRPGAARRGRSAAEASLAGSAAAATAPSAAPFDPRVQAVIARGWGTAIPRELAERILDKEWFRDEARRLVDVVAAELDGPVPTAGESTRRRGRSPLPQRRPICPFSEAS